MTVQRELWLVCDVCDAPSDQVGTGIDTVSWARRHGRDQDWHFSKGRDICAECWEKGER